MFVCYVTRVTNGRNRARTGQHTGGIRQTGPRSRTRGELWEVPQAMEYLVASVANVKVLPFLLRESLLNESWPDIKRQLHETGLYHTTAELCRLVWVVQNVLVKRHVIPVWVDGSARLLWTAPDERLNVWAGNLMKRRGGPEEPHTALNKAAEAGAVNHPQALSVLMHLLDATLDDVATALESDRRTVLRTVFPDSPY